MTSVGRYTLEFTTFRREVRPDREDSPPLKGEALWTIGSTSPCTKLAMIPKKFPPRWIMELQEIMPPRGISTRSTELQEIMPSPGILLSTRGTDQPGDRSPECTAPMGI